MMSCMWMQPITMLRHPFLIKPYIYMFMTNAQNGKNRYIDKDIGLDEALPVNGHTQYVSLW